MINFKDLTDNQKIKIEQVEKDYNNSYGNYHLNKYKEISKLLLLPDNYFKTVIEKLLNIVVDDCMVLMYKEYLVEFGYLPKPKDLFNYLRKNLYKGDILNNINYYYFTQEPTYFSTIEFENLESCDTLCVDLTLEKHFNKE